MQQAQAIIFKWLKLFLKPYRTEMVLKNFSVLSSRYSIEAPERHTCHFTGKFTADNLRTAHFLS
jgi:hypothetical protein